jgi:hypothetical protein
VGNFLFIVLLSVVNFFSRTIIIRAFTMSISFCYIYVNIMCLLYFPSNIFVFAVDRDVLFIIGIFRIGQVLLEFATWDFTIPISM